jgi:hypothetical protein
LDEIDLERILFDFSNTIGGFITYVLIQSLRLSPEITERSDDFEDKGLFAQKWIADTLSVLSENLIYIFETHTDLYLSRFLDINDPLANNKLNLAFANVYPFFHKELESVMVDYLKKLKMK